MTKISTLLHQHPIVTKISLLLPIVLTVKSLCCRSMRSQLLRIIQNWERSGQGEGGRHDGDDDSELEEVCEDITATTSESFGSLSQTHRPACALQNGAAFSPVGKPSFLLYFWESANRHQLLHSALQRLDSNVAASDASSAPSTTSTTAQSGKDDTKKHKGLPFRSRNDHTFSGSQERMESRHRQ